MLFIYVYLHFYFQQSAFTGHFCSRVVLQLQHIYIISNAQTDNFCSIMSSFKSFLSSFIFFGLIIFTVAWGDDVVVSARETMHRPANYVLDDIFRKRLSIIVVFRGSAKGLQETLTREHCHTKAT